MSRRRSGLGREPMARIRAARRRSDDGVSLLLALALVLGVGVIVGALLTYAGTSLTTMSAGDGAQRAYDVDGALQTAVDTIRVGTYDQDENLPDVGCLGAAPPSDVLTVPGETGPVAVRCSPKPKTGAASERVPINENNRFADAIHAGSEGLDQTARASALVRGAVRSERDIDVVGGPACAEGPSYPGGGTACGGLWVDGDVQANNGCTGTVVSLAGSAECQSTVSAVPAQASPAPSAATPYREVPACKAEVRLQPGIYDDAVALNKLTTGNTCAMNRLIIEPGTYFFDFRNEEAEDDPSLPFEPGDNAWTIDKSGLAVIGGEVAGAGVFEAFACVSPMKSTAAWGVRMVFGSNSRMVVKQGDVSLCGSYSLTDQPIVIQGSTADRDAESSATAKPTGGTTGSTSSGGFSPSGGVELAQAVSEAEEPPTQPNSAALNFTRQAGGATLWAEFSGYLNGANAIPKGSILTGATLNFKHRESGAVAGDSVEVTLDAGPGVQVQPDTQPSTRQDLTLDAVDLLSDELIDRAHEHGLHDLKLRYELTAAGGTGDIQAEIDLATLTFTWQPPVVRSQAGGTPVLVTSGGRFRVDGAIYVPAADVKLGLANVDYLVVSGGLVARHVDLAIEPKDGLTKPVIETPEISSGPKPLEVYLVAYGCSGGSCGSQPPGNGWAVVGTATVRFKDDDLTPGAPNRAVDVRSWLLAP